MILADVYKEYRMWLNCSQDLANLSIGNFSTGSS